MIGRAMWVNCFLFVLLINAIFPEPASAAASAQLEYKTGTHIFTSEDGLPTSAVTAMVQTRDGYLWLGTFGGLARFDGREFTVFKGQSEGHTADGLVRRYSGPPSERIISLHEDEDGRLWIGTQDSGLSVYQNGNFQRLPTCGGTCQVNDFLQVADNQLWVATGQGLLKLDPKTSQETWFNRVVDTYLHLSSDRQGRLYVGGSDGLHVMSEQGLRKLRLPQDESQVVLLERNDDKLWVGTERELYLYAPATQRWEPQGLSEPVRAARDPEGRWWVSLAPGKVVRQEQSGAWTEVPELAFPITKLAWDDEGNLWAGTYANGLLRARKSVFGLLKYPLVKANVPGRAVISDGLGGLLFGQPCGPVVHRMKDGAFQAVPLKPVVNNDCVYSLLKDEAGLWIGTTGGVLLRLNGHSLAKVASWPSGLPVHIWPADDGRHFVSIGTKTFEVRFDSEGRLTEEHGVQPLGEMTVVSVVPAVKGGRWFVGDRGAFRMLGNKIVERWTPAQGLSSRFARSLYEDSATGTLWIGTYGGGLNRIRNGRIDRYDRSNGLFDDMVSCILPDRRGRLWLGGNRGVTLIPTPNTSGHEIESIGYAAGEGLIPAEINGGAPNACYRDGNGRLWFSLVEGFAVLDPSDIAEVRARPIRPHIEYVAVAGRRQDISSSALVLEPFSRNVEIRYTAINLTKPQETRYRFRLIGFDQDWVEAGQNRSILYPSIPWGEHEFQVEAKVEGGPWSHVPARLRVVHPQPWYQLPWVWLLATSLGLLVLLGGTQFEKNAKPEPRA